MKMLKYYFIYFIYLYTLYMGDYYFIYCIYCNIPAFANIFGIRLEKKLTIC